MWGIEIPRGFKIMRKNEPIMYITWGEKTGCVCSRWLTKDEYKRSKVFIPEYIYPENITLQGLTTWMSTRTVPETRINLREILRDLYKLPEYAPFEMCKLDHGVQYADLLWIKWDGEDLNYEDVSLR